MLTTYHLDELVGTKLRALYQRKKGRDLFDLYTALSNGNPNTDKVLESYMKYMGFVVERVPSYKEFVNNMELKMMDDEFLTDVIPLLRPEIEFDPHEAYAIVKERLIDKLQRPEKW